jgi:hypothetical protein
MCTTSAPCDQRQTETYLPGSSIKVIAYNVEDALCSRWMVMTLRWMYTKVKPGQAVCMACSRAGHLLLGTQLLNTLFMLSGILCFCSTRQLRSVAELCTYADSTSTVLDGATWAVNLDLK